MRGVEPSGLAAVAPVPAGPALDPVPGHGARGRESVEAIYVSNVAYSHYSLLATVEAIFNLGTLGRNDTSAAPMSDMFRGGIP
jgi:hypothetical protein